jgi:hypothetical protein
MTANIEGEEGLFYGSVSGTTSSPNGYGIFKADEWVHCGKVEHNHFTDGKKVSVNRKEAIFKLVNSKSKADGAFF